jgi:ANTAR domain
MIANAYWATVLAGRDPVAGARLVGADVVAQAVLALQADAPPGKLALTLEVDADFQYVVHQASGMVAAQLDVNVRQAFVRLKAHAFGNDRPLAEVAEDVVARKLRFDARGGKADA